MKKLSVLICLLIVSIFAVGCATSTYEESVSVGESYNEDFSYVEDEVESEYYSDFAYEDYDVKSANISMDVADVSETVEIIKSDENIIIDSIDLYNYNEINEASIYMSVPVDEYDSTIEQIKGLGEVDSFYEDTYNLGNEYSNNNNFLELRYDQLDKLMELSENENLTTTEKIEIEKAIGDINKEINYYEDTRDNINNQVEYATINLTLSEKGITVPTISNIKDAFINSFAIVASGFSYLIYIIGFLIPPAIIIFIIYLPINIHKLVKKRKNK